MKGQYITTVIMMAALSGKKNNRSAAQKETITSMNNYKTIWSKEDNNNKTIKNKSVSEVY
jgi:hypothetical protein